MNTYLAMIRESATLIDVTTDLRGATRDPNDDAVLACAVDGNADYLVTGDEHLLALGSFQTIQMVTPDKFAGLLDSAQPR